MNSGIQLKAHQEKNSDDLVQSLLKYRTALDASDTGVGKTFTALAVAKKLSASPAIVCPHAVTGSWCEAARLLNVTPIFVEGYEACKGRKFKFGRITASGKQATKYQWETPARTLFIFDEVQRCRGRDTINSKMLLSAAEFAPVLLLSATPFTTPLEAYSIGAALRLFHRSDFYQWLFRNGVRKNIFGHLEFKGSETEMERIHRTIFPSKGVRTKRTEIPGFPESLITADLVDVPTPGEAEERLITELGEKSAADYDRAIERATSAYFETLPEGEEHVLPEGYLDTVQAQQITIDLRARQQAEFLKIPVMVEMARLSLERGTPVALFVNFDDTVTALATRLKTDCIVRGAVGQSAMAERATNISNFQLGFQQIIIVNSAAGGVGVSLHDPTGQIERTSIISPPWSAVVLRQVLGRVNRLGGAFSRQHIIFAAGTIEERVMERVRDRLNNLAALTDGDLDPQQL